MKKCFMLLSVILITLSCNKESIQKDKINIKKTVIRHSFHNYNIFESPWQSIVHQTTAVDIAADPIEQQMHEATYYAGYALKEMIAQQNFPDLVNDIKSSLDADSELILHNFFHNYPQYRAAAATVLLADYGMSSGTFDGYMDGLYNLHDDDYGLVLYVPLNTIEGADQRPVVAMAIELNPYLPSSSNDEDYSDDDAIPCFWNPVTSLNYEEGMIAYDDIDGTQKRQEIITAVIVVTAAVVVVTGVIWTTKKTKSIDYSTLTVDGYHILGTGNPGSSKVPDANGNFCEQSDRLICKEARFDHRYNKNGKSRIRLNRYVNHKLGPEPKRLTRFVKENITDMHKNDIGSKILYDLYELKGIDYTQNNAPGNQLPEDYYFLTMTYEHDWYATSKAYTMEFTTSGSKLMYLEVKGRRKFWTDFYRIKYIPEYDWCFGGSKIFTREGYALMQG